MNVNDSNYYNWTTFMRKNHLSFKEIVDFERMGETEVGIELQKIGMSKAGKLFWLMLQSFMIADKVAKAAWGYVQALSNGDEYNAKEEYANIERGLNDYAPAHFTPHRGDLAFAAEYFERMYNEAESKATMDEVKEVIFQYGARLAEMQSTPTAMVPLDARRVANGGAVADSRIFPCIRVGEELHLETEALTVLCGSPEHGVAERVLGMPTCMQCRQLSGVFHG